MVYATWTHYSTYYGGITDEKEFNKLNYRASAMLDAITANRAASATGYKASRLMDCACSLVDLLAIEQDTRAGTGVSSFSNDGYSETYSALTQEDVDTNHRAFIMAQLSGTGLVSAL